MAPGGICKAMTLLNFHNKQKMLYKNNIQYWNDSIYLTNWARLSSQSEALSRKKQHTKIASAGDLVFSSLSSPDTSATKYNWSHHKFYTL